jgi:hypothetical protein
MPQQYRAEPATITAHGRAVIAAGDLIDAELGRFETDALTVNDAFGWMGPSRETQEAYLEMANDTVAGLRRLVGQLHTDGQNLNVSALNYGGADEASDVGGR